MLLCRSNTFVKEDGEVNAAEDIETMVQDVSETTSCSSSTSTSPPGSLLTTTADGEASESVTSLSSSKAVSPQSGVGSPLSGVGSPLSGVGSPQSGAKSGPQSGMGSPQSGLGSPQSKVGSPQSGAKSGPQSGMRSPQSRVGSPQSGVSLGSELNTPKTDRSEEVRKEDSSPEATDSLAEMDLARKPRAEVVPFSTPSTPRCSIPQPSPQADIFSLKHESSIFRSVIQPCMWFLHDGTG